MNKNKLYLITIIAALLLLLCGCVNSDNTLEDSEVSEPQVAEENGNTGGDENQDYESNNNDNIENDQENGAEATLSYVIEHITEPDIDQAISDDDTEYVRFSGEMDLGRYEVIVSFDPENYEVLILIYDNNDIVTHKISHFTNMIITDVLADNVNRLFLLALYTFDIGQHLIAIDYEGNQVFGIYDLTQGYIHNITQNSTGTYAVVHSYFNQATDEGEQGLFVSIYNSHGFELKSIVLLDRSDINYREDELNPGYWYQEIYYAVLGILDNTIYFITSSYEEDPTEYRTYLHGINLDDETKVTISINDALGLNDVLDLGIRNDSFYLSEDDLKIVFPIFTRVFQGDFIEREDVRFIVYDIMREIFLVTDVIEEMSSAPHAPSVGNYSFMFYIWTGSEPNYEFESYKITLVFE